MRAPQGRTRTSSGKVNRLGRWGGFGKYNLREWYEGHIPRRKLTGAWTLPSIPFLRTSTRGTQGTTGSPHGTRKPAGRDVLRRTQRATLDGASQHQGASQAALTTLTAKHRTATPTRQPHNPGDTA